MKTHRPHPSNARIVFDAHRRRTVRRILGYAEERPVVRRVRRYTV